MTKKKIICYPFVGDKIGGSHISTILLAKKIKGKLLKPIVVLHKEGVLTKYLRSKRVKYYKLKNGTFLGEKKILNTNFFKFIKTLIEIVIFIKKNKIDLVHTNDTRIHLMWTLASKICYIKTVWHQRSNFPNWPLYKTINKVSNKVISISNYVFSSIPQNIQKKTVVIYNPFSFKYEEKSKKKIVKNKILSELKIPHNSKIVTYVSNLEERKKPIKFLHFAENLKRIYKKKIIFIVIGEKRDKKLYLKFKNIVKDKDYIFYLGYKSNPYFYMYGSDLFFAPYTNEPFGRTIVESMLLKTPVLASNSGGHKEIIKDSFNGFFFL